MLSLVESKHFLQLVLILRDFVIIVLILKRALILKLMMIGVCSLIQAQRLLITVPELQECILFKVLILNQIFCLKMLILGI